MERKNPAPAGFECVFIIGKNPLRFRFQLACLVLGGLKILLSGIHFPGLKPATSGIRQ
jgi:hypothetical protein